MERKSIVGKRIAYYRRRRGYTQKKVSEQLNVSIQAVSKWEKGLTCPDIMLLPRLADLFGVKIDDLFENRDGKD